LASFRPPCNRLEMLFLPQLLFVYGIVRTKDVSANDAVLRLMLSVLSPPQERSGSRKTEEEKEKKKKTKKKKKKKKKKNEKQNEGAQAPRRRRRSSRRSRRMKIRMRTHEVNARQQETSSFRCLPKG